MPTSVKSGLGAPLAVVSDDSVPASLGALKLVQVPGQAVNEGARVNVCPGAPLTLNVTALPVTTPAASTDTSGR